MKPIAVLGPQGTFTGQAAKKMHPNNTIQFMDSVGDVFEKVVDDDLTGVVALENSLEGGVGETINHLLNDDVYIINDFIMEVRFSLVGNQKDPAVVDEILSHPHALGQCKKNLTKLYPDAVLVPVNSTTDALSQIKGKPKKLAVALEGTAMDYGLEIVKNNIQDSYSETRFISIKKTDDTGGKTSIIFALKDKPGALYEILKVFAENKLNLTKIESRPARTQLGDYVFFVDFENNHRDLEKIFQEIRKQTTFLKNLGSYNTHK